MESFAATRPVQVLYCKTCGLTFYEAHRLRSHAKQHNSKRHPCEICFQGSFTMRKLSHHILAMPVMAAGKVYSCEANLRKHERRVLRMPHRNKTESAVWKHLRNADTRPVQVLYCGTCGLSFYEKHLLKSHAKQHSSKWLSRRAMPPNVFSEKKCATSHEV